MHILATDEQTDWWSDSSCKAVA